MIFKELINYVFLISFILNLGSSQELMIYPHNFSVSPHELSLNKLKKGININFNQQFYLNTNLPNFENQNGLYAPKGHGSLTSFLFGFNSKNMLFTFEPVLKNKTIFNIIEKDKPAPFSVLNDVVKKDHKDINVRNIGLKFRFKGLSFGYSNWNLWWGPGLHNSLILSNNTNGFYHYFFGTDEFLNITENISFRIKYVTSESFKNTLGSDFFYTGIFLNLKYKFLHTGFSKSILSGGRDNIIWRKNDAIFSIFTKKNYRYWDILSDFYIKLDYKKSGIVVFLNIGQPESNKIFRDNNLFANNFLGSNMGLRKRGIFDIDELEIGFEYARLVQGIYYNLTPTPNWYDNIKYSYYSYNERRWGAHSGADSDDLLIYMAYSFNTSRLALGLNFERHGVTYHFPPEVKIETKFAYSFYVSNYTLSLSYENEYYEHYAFVDKNINVWTQTFENGSIQRTNTILFSFITQLN
tara:strand:+ start:176 stop:1573 length:1398 start_codon:yes stop_codon:yes gene_type:complete